MSKLRERPEKSELKLKKMFCTYRDVMETIGDISIAKLDEERVKGYTNENLPPYSRKREYIRSKEEFEKAKEELKEVSKNYDLEMKEVAKKIEYLKEREINLRNRFISHDLLVKESNRREELVNEKIRKEKEKRLKIKGELDKLNRAEKKLSYVVSFVKKETKKFGIYEDFLQKVVDNEKTRYRNVEDVINHYKSLTMIRESLAKSFSEKIKELEDYNTEASESINEMIERLLIAVNKLKNAQDDLRRCKIETEDSSRKFEIVKNKAIEGLENYQVIQNFIGTILRGMINLNQATPEAFDYPVHKQFQMIKYFILDLRNIVKMVESDPSFMDNEDD